MLIIGAKGFAKQLVDVIDQMNLIEQVVLYDGFSVPQVDKLYGIIPILHTEEEVIQLFTTTDNRFIIGIGKPSLRYDMACKFTRLGGAMETLISPKALVSRFATIGKGVTLLSNVIVEGDVTIGEGALINIGALITHDCVIGDYVEICPGVKIGGRCRIGSFSTIGTGAVIIPNIEVGRNVTIAAGSVVTQNIPDNVMVAGVPAAIKKRY
ncbi:MAG TPA: acetyltransferase [Flavisolibacter sp.]|nr:acetyltransferase [Flavisolibacter sp.]